MQVPARGGSHRIVTPSSKMSRVLLFLMTNGFDEVTLYVPVEIDVPAVERL
jgi:hypothetical protein